ncbi:hypothetical protein V7S43_011491 [Phytophthora oleae]|uniref:Kinesin motor domain-containing protein n=1 Tax=Phytophthora oleae TaxID=2107226 RepID=A0ABD3FCD9_9STRA
MNEIATGADEGESAREILSSSYDGVAGLFDSPTPSAAASTSETIDSREDAQYYDEWNLFSDAASEENDDSDNELSSDPEAQQPAPTTMDNQQTEAALVLERSQQNDIATTESDRKRTLQVVETPTSATVLEDTTGERPTSQSDSAGVRRQIQVLVRVRPPFDSEGKVVVTAGEKKGTSLCIQSTTSQGSISTVTECTFDRVFMGGATQEDVFSAIEPNVQACLEGYNATVFAYGQTGTGKTHTLFGRDLGSSTSREGESDSFRMVKSSWGIVPRALNCLLGQASVLQHKSCQVELHLSFLQIYNDRLFDLLTDRMRQKPLLIREQPTLEGTTSVTVQGLSSERVTSFSNAMQIIHRGFTSRSVRETESNLASSRSHAIVQIYVTTEYPASKGAGQVFRKARLNLVDLAGSEKWNTDVEMEDAHSQELKNINASLSALGNCIAALTEAGRKHIPYRDSILTRVLQDSFGGNTQSCLIATVNATQQSCDETIRTLQFADRARSVMQTIRVNEVVDGSTELLMAKIQIVKLRERLESEQRRRHDTRLKEHQTMQRDFQEKIKGKENEITKLTRDNAVFLKWREEDVKKIRGLESRVKELEQQMGEEGSMVTATTAVQRSKRSSAATAKNTPVRKSRSRTNLTRVGSENGTTTRTSKQMIERYDIGPNKGQQSRTAQTNKATPNQDSPQDPTNQSEDLSEPEQPVPDLRSRISQHARWEALGDSQVGEPPEASRPDVNRHLTSGLCVSPVIFRPNENLTTKSPASSTKSSWAYANVSAIPGSERASSILSSKSAPALSAAKQETKEPWYVNPANGSTTSLPRQEHVSLLKNFSTGSFSYNAPMLGSVVHNSAIEPCSKHKLAGCMLCTVGDNFRQSQVAPVRQPSKELVTTSTVMLKAAEASRTPQDGPCVRHQLLRCFICMKDSKTTTGSTIPPTATAGYNYTIPASTSSIKTSSYLATPIGGETQSKCALHSLANCILCAGVKAMTRKAVVPTPQAPAKTGTTFEAASAIHLEDRNADRYRRYTLDERMLHQSKLANQW